MNRPLGADLADSAGAFRRRLAMLYTVLIAANVGAWLWAWAAFADRPALLGLALLAWVFGLRHAVDADHIAAIDNVVRKLMYDGQHPLGVGFFFSLGHSMKASLLRLFLKFCYSASFEWARITPENGIAPMFSAQCRCSCPPASP